MRSSLQSNRNQQGFTLIELVVVIVILGILAVTAAPKFIDISNDARAAAVESLGGALRGARDLNYAKSLVSGTGTYPTTAEISTKIDFSGFDEASAGVFTLTGYTGSNCSATYAQGTLTTDEPTITVDVGGC
jgi:MSHA pilin protein MshA